MMNPKIKITLILLLSSLVLVSCKKYEDGPLLSFRSEVARITGEWKIDKYYVNGDNATEKVIAEYGKCIYTIDKDGNLYSSECGNNKKINGEWGFTDKKAKDININIYYPLFSDKVGPFVTGKPLDWNIVKLRNKKLWIMVSYMEKTYEIRFKKENNLPIR